MWTEESEDHIARHGVTAPEVEELVNSRPRYVARGRNDTTIVYGVTAARRYLLVVLNTALDARWYVVTARDMTRRERLTFQKKGH